jgi:dTMP kinase
VSAANPPAAGRFITIEGPEGAGKTIQAERLGEAIRALGHRVIVTREPGGTTAGERIRELLLAVRDEPDALIPRTDAFLFNAARAQLVAEVIEPALARGDTVVGTRFADSTLAYQGYGAGLDLGALRELEAIATGGLRPDLTILLDLPSETGLARKTGAELTRFETQFDLEFHRRVRDGFLRLAAAEPGRFAVVDAGVPIDAVAADVLAAAAGLPGLEDLVRRRPPPG